MLAEFAELRAAVEVSPWTVGDPLVPANPTGLRLAVIGPDGTALVVFQVLEQERIVLWVQVSFL